MNLKIGRCGLLTLGIHCCAALVLAGSGTDDASVVEIGGRRELFVDDYIIAEQSDEVELRLHQPVIREIVLTHDEPWEGAGSGYHSVFKDGDKYRMYYKAWQRTIGPNSPDTDKNPLLCCYAESVDGINWRKPALGIHEFGGSRQNNIVMASAQVDGLIVDAGHPAVFRDDNPNAPADARYKAFFRSAGPRGVLAFKSVDGLHWTPMAARPVLTEGAFDSQNLAFWDSIRQEYRAYWRYFRGGKDGSGDFDPKGVRCIRTATSADFLNWSNQANLDYGEAREEQLYTNQIYPYERAPHLFFGFPARYVDRGWSDSMCALPERAHREWRAARSQRLGTALTDTLFMVSRDGVAFRRWNQAFLPPGPERPGTWTYGQQFIAWHPVVTKSALEGAPDELSFYVSESYWSGRKGSTVRRYTLRMDGFVSVHVGMAGGELVTKAMRFSGQRLTLNFATSAAGSIRVEIQEPDGSAVPGFRAEDCAELFGDAIDRIVTWKGGSDVSVFAGKAVRLRFVMKEADLFALQFSALPSQEE